MLASAREGIAQGRSGRVARITRVVIRAFSISKPTSRALSMRSCEKKFANEKSAIRVIARANPDEENLLAMMRRAPAASRYDTQETLGSCGFLSHRENRANAAADFSVER